MVKKPKAAVTAGAIKRKPKPKRTPAVKVPASGALRLHPVVNDKENMVKLEWSSTLNGYTGSVISLGEAAQIAATDHPPTVSPVYGDPTKKIRCDWNVQDNQYICEVIDANDPRAHVP